MRPTTKLLSLAALVAALQSGVLGWMVYDRSQLIADGREVLLEVQPVDPRSLFRGDYVILNYTISRAVAPAGVAPNAKPQPAYVILKHGPDGIWTGGPASFERPTRTGPDEVVIAGRAQYVWSDATTTYVQMRYGIESYYLPEGAGKDIEKMIGEKKIAVAVAVDEAGRSGVKGLVVDGRRVIDEPLY